MKYIVTTKNIKSIAKMIEKISKGKTLTSQSFYPTEKRKSVILKSIGINKPIILKSNISIFNEVVVETDYNDSHFIRVHNNNYTNNSFDYSNYKAFIIYCGDTIEFKNNILYLRTQHPTKEKEKAIKVIKFI